MSDASEQDKQIREMNERFAAEEGFVQEAEFDAREAEYDEEDSEKEE